MAVCPLIGHCALWSASSKVIRVVTSFLLSSLFLPHLDLTALYPTIVPPGVLPNSESKMEAVDALLNFVDQNGALTIVLLTAVLLLIRSVVVAIPRMVRYGLNTSRVGRKFGMMF